MKGSFSFRPLHYEAGSENSAPFNAQVGELQLNFFESYRFPPDSPDKYLELQDKWDRNINILD